MKKAALFFLVLILTACAPAVVPSPTSTPTATGTVTPTVTSSPTVTPSSTPVPNGPCDNPLVPLAIGNQWTYRVGTGSGESLYTLKALERRDSRNIVMVVEFADQKKGETVQELVVCQDGAIENFPLFVMDMLFADQLNKFMNTYHNKGSYAPAHATFVENGWVLDWQTDYLTEDSATITSPSGGPGLVLVQSSPIDLFFETDGTREAVSVPAGEFPQALKVLHNFTVSATFGSGGGYLTIETTQWYEPFVGLVRARVDTASFTTGGQKASVPLTSILELVDFTPGK